MNFYFIIFTLFLFATSACTKINIETKTTNLYPKQEQFVNLYADSLGVEFMKESLPPGMDKGFNVKGIIAYGNELFCTNLFAKRIDIFDIKTLKYKESIIDPDTKMFSRDVYVDNQYIYVLDYQTLGVRFLFMIVKQKSIFVDLAQVYGGGIDHWYTPFVWLQAIYIYS